jgi:8-oxo-dGTP pyrophosphatase MutT (NUDIX family)
MEYTKHTVCCALRCGDKLWMSQRVLTPNFAGKWQFPGGKMDKPGETNPIDAVLRELKEETNLDIDINRLKYLGGIHGDPTTACCYVYYIDLNEAEIPVRTENTMTDWVLLSYDEAMSKDLMPGLANSIRMLKDERYWYKGGMRKQETW